MNERTWCASSQKKKKETFNFLCVGFAFFSLFFALVFLPLVRLSWATKSNAMQKKITQNIKPKSDTTGKEK